MASISPWIYINYKLLVQDSMHMQMHVADNFDVASAMALVRAGVASRGHTEPSLVSELRSLDSLIGLACFHIGIGSTANASRGSSSTINQHRSRAPLRPCRQLDSAEEKENLQQQTHEATELQQVIRQPTQCSVTHKPDFHRSHLTNIFIFMHCTV